jgi:hypothetical protein
MFGDMGILTIWISLNVAIVMLATFMYQIFRSSTDRNRQEVVVRKERANRRF